MPPVECKLDIKSFEGTVAGTRPHVKAARELEKIARDFRLLLSGSYRLKVDTEEKQQGGSEDKEETEI